MKKEKLKYIILLVPFLLVSCATYHDLSVKYQQQLQHNNFDGASKQIERNKYLQKKNNKLLYFLEKGKLAHLQKDYVTSNSFFNKADALIGYQKKNIARQALGVLLNPEKENYKSEDFEKVSIHYYKALNYIFLSEYDEALVEAKRINLDLQKINDKYAAGKKNRYSSDAFALNLQGLLYELLGDINNAFIAYRNAVELYQKNRGSYFGVTIPKQLQQDVVNMAHLLGFYDLEKTYSQQFGIRYDDRFVKNKNVVVFWENGLVPYKSQTYFTFTAMPGDRHGVVYYTNEELGFSLPIPTKRRGTNFSDLEVINVAFPKYESRFSYYKNAWIELQNKQYNFELIEDYNTIAKQTLKDRTLREIGKTVARLATKKIAEASLSNQNENLGALLGLFNAFTEKTDTRNWQTLPNQIYYTRIPVLGNSEKIKIKTSDRNGNVTEKELDVSLKKQITIVNHITPQINVVN